MSPGAMRVLPPAAGRALPEVDVLLATCNRLESLVMTLSGIAGQHFSAMRVIVSDQSRDPVEGQPVVAMLRRILEARGMEVEWHYRFPSLGMVEQRDFLLRQSTAPAVLYLADDVFLQPWVVETLLQVLREEECAFVGSFPCGLSRGEDSCPDQPGLQFWEGPVQPETLEPDTPEWERRNWQQTAEPYHLGLTVLPGETRRCRVAWIASCVLYDRGKLLEVGGFAFWNRLPRDHSGEEVLVQNLLMRRWGGCAILPSGFYCSEIPSSQQVSGQALRLLPEMIRKYVPGAVPPGT